MFRGRGTPNRRSGESRAQDYRSSQQNNRSGGGGHKNDIDASPRSRFSSRPPKSEPQSPFSSASKSGPPGASQPSQESTHNESNHNRSRGGATPKEGRARSRSPVGRKEEPVPTPGAENDEAAAAAPADAVPKEEVKIVKYPGRPGEKKFSGRCRLFIANLHTTTTDEELRELFSEFGDTGEVYVNRDKGFGFIRLDYRHNAEVAKLTLDKKLWKGRNIQVRYATHASAIELHGLDNFASNEFIEKAMSVFGAVERAIVVCDDRGRSKGYAIVEFEWKKSAAKVLDRLKDEMFVLGRLPKPVFAKPYILTDEEEGVREETLERLEGLEAEREVTPRFVSPQSFEYVWAKRWRDLFIEEQDKKARLEQELTDARCKLEFEMEAAIRNQEAVRIREDLHRRQEELRRLEEEMIRRQEADMRILERSRQREMAARSGHPEMPPRDESELINNEIQLSRENAARQQDFANLRQRAEMQLQEDPFSNNNDRRGPMPPHSKLGARPDMMSGQGFSRPPHPGMYQGGQFGGHPGAQGGPRPMMPAGGMQDYRTSQSPRGPPPREMQREMQQREMQQREMQQREMQQREMQQRRGEMPPRDGPPRDGPPRDGAPRDGPQRDGPQRDGPPRDGPPRDGPPRDTQPRELMAVREPPPRDMPQRDLPQRDLPSREVPGREALPKEKGEEKTEVSNVQPDPKLPAPQSTKPPAKLMETWNIF